MELTYIQYLILIFLGVLIYILKFSVPKYLEKKAENLAQTEDIEKLTTLVKEVESKFEERSQNLRAQLDLHNQFKVGLHNEERSSIIILHNTSFEYYNLLCDSNFGNINRENNVEITSFIHTKNAVQDKFFHSKVSAMLFLDDNVENEIEEIVMDMNSDFLKFTNQFLDHLHEISNLNIVYENREKIEITNEYYKQREILRAQHHQNILNLISIVGPKLMLLTRELKRYMSIRTSNHNTSIS